MATTFDNKANFVYSTVLTAPSPATTGTSLTIQAADASNFPDPSTYNYNLVVFPVDTQPTAANAEIVRVTAKSSNVLTISREQEGTSARTILVGDQVMLAPTAKVITDIETAIGTIETWKDSITSSVAELNILDGVTANKDEINVLDGMTSNTAELNKLDGVSGAVVGTTDTQTLTNKTLTSPTINTPTTTLANNAALKAKDSGGTARDLIKATSGNIATFGSADFTENAVVTQSKARAYMNSNQSVATATWTKMNLDTESFDIGSDFDTTNKRFVARVTGYYVIIGKVSALDTGGSGVQLIAGLFKNAGGTFTTPIQSNKSYAGAATDDPATMVVTIEYLTANDYIELCGYHTYGSNRTFYSGAHETFMAVHLLSI